jgi:protein-L-isoaspartate(D-aspartate) O-methyltransferase
MDKKEKMIAQQLQERDIHDERVIQAVSDVDREVFLPDHLKEMAYDDAPVPIGREQTISQPYIVAYMAQVLNLQPGEKVLEVGSGSGYNAAVMAKIVSHVYSIEIIEWLAKLARKNLLQAGIKNITIKYGNGYEGWPENAPFDKIVLTAATPFIPEPLLKQLKINGMILAPVVSEKTALQKLILIEKKAEAEFTRHDLIHVQFVPMTRISR